MSEKWRSIWMSDFEDACKEMGVPHETIQGPEHQKFWDTAYFFYTQRMSAKNAAERYVKTRMETKP